MPAGPLPITSTFFFSAAGARVSSFSSSKEGFTVQATRLPNMMPFRQRRQPMQGRMSSAFSAATLLANSGSHRFARPIMQMSALPLAISSSAIQGSVMRPTVATGMDTYFLISAAVAAWEPMGVPGAGMELPRAMVVPPETCRKSTPAFSSCLAT